MSLLGKFASHRAYREDRALRKAATWDDLQNMKPSGPPIRLSNNGLVVRYRDGIFVPEWIDDDWELLTSIDASTYSGPPTGWAESGVVGVVGGYIRVKGSGGGSSLTYTIGSLSAGDTVVLVLDGYGVAGSGGTDMAAVRLLDSIENGIAWFRIEYGDGNSYMLTGASYGGLMSGLDSRARVCIVWSDETFWGVEMDGYRHWAAERGFTGSSGTDQVQFYVNSPADTSYIYLKTCHIYKGVLP